MSSSVDHSHRGGYRALFILFALLAAAPLVAQTSPAQPPDPGFGGVATTKIYSLIHFEADSARLTPVQRRVLEEYIFEGITSERNPMVEVVGYTDVMGTSEHNQQLSLRRAESVAGAIRKGVSREHYSSLRARGTGEESPMYTNDLPEGRFYNRTVQIRVITPHG